MDWSISWSRKTVSTALERWTSVDFESAKPPEWYLNRATECLEQAHWINSGSDGSPSVKVFRMQCDYLVQKLESAVNVSRGTYRNSTPSRKHKSRHHEIPKLLYWLAIQVQGFVDDCCKDEHMQAALTAALVPMSVSSLGIQLELYRTALSCNISSLLADEPASLSQENLKSLRETEKHEVETRASCDKDNLLHSLRSLIELGKSSSAQATLFDTLKSLITSHTSSKADRNFQLATMVQKRLDVASQAVSTSGPSRSLSLEAWKVDGKDLRRLQELGAGMSAKVYKSEWLGSVLVAEKVFGAPSNADFEREISLLAMLSHPSIVSILGYWTDEKSSAIVTELMDGDLNGLMTERLKRGNPGMRPFSISVACDTMLQVAEGVEYIHEKGVSHRDLKSQNVLVRRSKDNDIEYVCAKVADFGLSKTKESSLACTHQTSNTGSWRSIAPEMIGAGMEKIRERERLHPRKSDVYSFGMLCFEIFTGELPFSVISIPRVVKEKVKAGERPRLPPECPEELRSLIELCWHCQPDKRPYMSEVCERLRRIKYSLVLEDLKSEVTVPAPPPEWYLDKIKQCMEHVQQMTSGPLPDSTGVKMYHLQCQFLGHALELAVEVCCPPLGQLGFLRLLLELATQIKRFVEDCCNKEWVKIALISPSVAPAPSVTVSTLAFYLKFITCTVLPDNSNNLDATQLESLKEDVERAVAKEAGLDEQNLLNTLQSLIVSSKSNSLEAILSGKSSNADRIQLATILQKKLKASQSVSTRSSQHPTTYLKTDLSTIMDMRSLGQGTSASVYSGIWFGAKVAIKTFDYRPNETFQNEVSILGRLCHPNIVNILGYSHDGRKLDLLMDLMDEDLNSFMARRLDMQSRRDMVLFNTDEAVDLMLQVANGVNYLHELKLVHRDLKSRKILVKVIRNEKDIPDLLCVKVADFGMSVRLDSEVTIQQNFIDGTVRYQGPELFQEYLDADVETMTDPLLKNPMKSDVYSFGMLCYEILTGDLPFSEVEDLRRVRRMVLNGERPELPPQCPSALKTLIEACWHANPSDRPTSKQICQELRYLKYTLLLKESSGESSAQQRYQLARPVPEAQLKLQHDLLEHLSRLRVTKVEYSDLERGIQLGRGGTETAVYKTIYDRSNVAEKRYVTAYNEDFKRELTMLADLKHPNIVTLIGFAMSSRSCSIIMEKMDGDLHDLMRMRMSERKTTPTGPFSLKDAVHIMLQIAHGMHSVHEKNVVHRDLKSKNILVNTTGIARQPGVVKVADFGLSEKLKPGSISMRFNIGTVRWMAPEVMMLQNDVNVGKSPGTSTGPVSSKLSNALGNMPLMSDKQVKEYPDPFKSDMYSFGIVCFEILTGCAPAFHLNNRSGSVPREEPVKAEFKEEDNEALKEKVLAGHRPILPIYCPPKLKALIESCWDKDASSRPSFAQIIAALKDVL